ncbi:hypothetical protein L288_19985 [Sphingobium quisquiliarum P25]|uniref:Sulfatase N-terminal domain-containing protein n=1 Tax=Sphingobium quisquiliarum P25 TaxID=1329909 RepID=T0HP77_9SPHN|nr:hypothetical protein [Sphingobium quisquiliarum]EQA99313.1 hypothetical protein L288_19985 [Sphingobium quisquiliarum P25]
MAETATAIGRGDVKDSAAPSKRVEQITGWQAALAALAVMGALLLNVLLFHQYLVWTPEAGVALAVLAGIALIYGALYGFAHRLIRALLEGVLIATALNVADVHAPWPIAAGVAVAAFVALGRKSVLPFITVAALVAAGASVLGIGQRREAAVTMIHKPVAAANPSSTLPAIVHIILDEHAGIDGMPEDNPRTAAVKLELERFYLGNGFRLYTRAHSDYAYTLNSIPQILNFGEAQEPERSKAEKKKVEKVAYFDALGQRGYRVKVYQSEYLNLCGPSPVTDCLTYQSQNIGPVATSSLSTGSRAQIILRKLVSPTFERLGASAYNGLRRLGLPLPVRDITELRMNPLNAALAFDRFNSDLAAAGPGEVYLGHFLLPHSPFGLTPDCRLKEGAWMRRQYPGSFTSRENAGYDQLLCTLKKTEAAYRAISKSPAGHNFIMVVHGDHGSRMTNAKPDADQAKLMTDKEKLANFSALFAVRAPAIPGGKDAAPLSLSALMKGLAQSRFSLPPEGKADVRSQVYLADDDFIPRTKITLPEGW